MDIVNGSPNLEKIDLFGSVLQDIERTQRICVDYNKRIVSRYHTLLEHLARLPVCKNSSCHFHYSLLFATAHDR